ncbi:MAG: hypothetical protein U1A77_01910 [Pirellulales bacterium]
MVCDREEHEACGSTASIAEDAAVDAHLAVCHECRMLAEGLRPAVALLRESRDLPEYRGRLPAIDYGQVARVSLPPESPRVASDGRGNDVRAERIAWPMVAIALVGVIVGVGLTHLRDSQSDVRKPSWLAWNSLGERADDHWTFASLRLSEACREPRERQFASGGALAEERVVCCTRCHASSASRAAVTSVTPPVEMSRLLVACLACHEG